MTCSNCGRTNRAGRKFCANCGFALALSCPVCGVANEPGERFCGECGSGLESGAVAPGAAPETPSADDVGRLAERRLVSVLFADLVGFTPYSETRDAEDVRTMLSRYFEIATAIVTRYGGAVEKFIGDAVMAVWGTPIAHEDDAERAVRAALDLVAAVPTLGPELQARAGVLTGEVAVTLGAENEGMVVGDIVNTAARLQSVAEPGSVLVGDATFRAAGSSIAFEPAGPLVLKGKTAPVPAWLAQRAVDGVETPPRGQLPDPPFVGRDEELRALRDALEATGRERRPRLVSITGPGGIGKSRLAREFEQHVDGLPEDVYWHRGRCPAYGDGITFWALGEMVRRRAGLLEGADEVTTREAIARTVEAYLHDPDERRWVEPALLALLGIEDAPPGGRDTLFAAWRVFFERIAARGTTVLLFEDLQWADSGLLDFVDHVLEWARSVPILVVTLARPELLDRRAGWGSASRSLVSLALPPLPDAAMRELLAGLVPGLPEHAVGRIVARAEGVPLYAVELVRMLVADGRVVAGDGGYEPRGDLTSLTIPETLRSLIASRLDALEPPDRALVQDAAVLGQVFTAPALAAVSERDEAAVTARIRGLIRRELFELEADPRSPERGQYRFVQSLIREVAYGTLAKGARRARHLAVARFFEALGDEELAGALASHYLAAHQASASGPAADAVAIQARIALQAAARRASGLAAHAQAVTYLRQALEVTSDPAERAAILVDAARAADVAADTETAEHLFGEAIQLHTALGDRPALGRDHAWLGQALMNAGRIPDATAVLERALRDVPPDDEAVRARLLTSLSRAAYRRFDPALAVRLADEALPIIERLNLEELAAEALTNKGSALSDLGRRREAQALLEAAVRRLKAVGDGSTFVRATNNLATTLDQSDPRRAAEVLREGYTYAQRIGDRSMAEWLQWSSIDLDFYLGDDWTGPMAEIEEALTSVSNRAQEHRFLYSAVLYGAARDDPQTGSFAERLLAVGKLTDEAGSAEAEESILATRRLLAGDPTGAYEHLIAPAERVEIFIETAVPWAIHAAAWSRDVARLRRAVDLLAASRFTGAVLQAPLAVGRAGIAALEGRTADALDAYRRARRGYADLQLHTHLALSAIDMLATIGTDEPEVRVAAEDARAAFVRLGARALLQRLDEAGGPGGSGASTRPSARRQEASDIAVH